MLVAKNLEYKTGEATVRDLIGFVIIYLFPYSLVPNGHMAF